MRNVFLLILISVSSVRAVDTYAQKPDTEINVTSGTIASIFEQIRQQSELEFFYNTNILDVNRSVVLKHRKGTLDDILSEVLGDKYTYTIKDRYVLITEKTRENNRQAEVVYVRGNVVGRDLRPIVGATVLLKGSTIGTATDAHGAFALRVPSHSNIVLTVSFLGMQTQEVKYNGEASLRIILEEGSQKIEDVVVTGYQTISKERMTGAVDVITAKDIAFKGYTNVEDILKGQFAGVVTMSLSGRPGAQSSVRIRGINSLDGDINPIWIVDGMPLQGDVPEISMGGTEFQETVLTSGIGNIAPDEIESITILKDAAATAIYGARAANGVVVVTTKRGTIGKSYINVQSSFGISEAPENRLKMMNTAQKMEFERGMYEDFPGLDLGGRVYQIYKKSENGTLTSEEAARELDRLSRINTDWFKEIFRTGQTQNHSVSLSGGDEKTQYYASLSYLGEKGIIPNNKYESIGASIKLTHDFNDWFRINFDVRSTLRNDRSSASSVNPLDYATYANPYEQPYDEYGNYEYDRSSYPTLSQITDGYKYDFNIFEDLNRNTSKTRYLSSQMILKLEFTLMEGLIFSSMGTFSNSNNHTTKELTPGTYSSKRNLWLSNFFAEGEVSDDFNNGQISESTSRSQGWTVRNQLEFARGLGGERHYLNLLLGQEISSTMSQGFSSMIPEWSDVYGVATYPDLSGIELNSSKTLYINRLGSHTESQNRNVSFYFIGSYSFMDRYVFQGSIRFEGADIIGTENQFSPLWNISGKWNLHNEEFMSNLPFFNQLALRASYGYTGNIDRRALPFSYMQKVNNYSYDGEKLMDRYYPANPSIKWQRKEDISFGLDLSVLNHRINFTVNYYNNTTRDVLGENKVAASTGRQSIKANIASLRNKGWELSLRTVNIRTRDFTWITSFNIAFNDDKILDTYYKSLNEVSYSTNSSSSLYNLSIQGMPIRAFYGYPFAGIDPYDGNTLAYIDGFNDKGERLGSPTGDGRYIFNMDANYNTQYLSASRKYIGKSDPSTTGGFSTQLNYRRWSLSANFTFMLDFLARNYMYYDGDLTVAKTARNVQVTQANRWRKPGDITDVARYSTSRTEYLYQLLDFRFDKGDYLKCNNISVGYNVSPDFCYKVGISRARVNLNMANVFTATKFRGIDPETKGNYGYPSARSYKISLSIGF